MDVTHHKLSCSMRYDARYLAPRPPMDYRIEILQMWYPVLLSEVVARTTNEVQQSILDKVL